MPVNHIARTRRSRHRRDELAGVPSLPPSSPRCRGCEHERRHLYPVLRTHHLDLTNTRSLSSCSISTRVRAGQASILVPATDVDVSKAGERLPRRVVHYSSYLGKGRETYSTSRFQTGPNIEVNASIAANFPADELPILLLQDFLGRVGDPCCARERFCS